MSTLEQRLSDRIWTDLFKIPAPNSACDTLSHAELMDVIQPLLQPPLDIPTQVLCHPDRYDAAFSLVDEIAKGRGAHYLGELLIVDSTLVPKDKLMLADGSRIVGIIDIGELK